VHRSQRFCHFFNRTLDIVFREGVEHRPRFCLDHLTRGKMAILQFYNQSGKQQRTKAGE
jgi:hypothetical protein